LLQLDETITADRYQQQDLKRYKNALMTLSLRNRCASIVKKFASYPKGGKTLLMKTKIISLINSFYLFLNKD